MSSNKNVAAKKTVSKKTTTKETVQSVPAVVAEETTEVVDGVVDSTEESSTDKRKLPTRDSVIQSFDDLIKSIETEMETLREGDSTKNKGIKFLRTLNKRIKILKNQSSRIIKQKRVSTKKSTNNNSRFQLRWLNLLDGIRMNFVLVWM